MRSSFAHARLLGPVLAIALAACEPPAPDHTAARLECLRGCAGKKDACILGAQSAPQIQQCDEQNQACVGSCPP
ncbi:MAG: hypothetical protein HOO96_05240 [Polyangiaceae bacterium]|nr:hypothetical protein [Polyangiaceae bacterium]